MAQRLEDYPAKVAPGPNALSGTMGVTSGAWILRAAIVEGLRDLRLNPWQIDFILARWRLDSLTREQYGQKMVEVGKKWFLSTPINVLDMPRPGDSLLWPAVTIAETGSQETDNTLGDINYEPMESVEVSAEPEAISVIFAPSSWNPETRALGIPTEIWANLVIVPGQMIKEGVSGRLTEIVAVGPGQTVTLAPGAETVDSQVVIAGKTPTHEARIEAVNFRSQFQIGCVAAGEVWKTDVLWALVVSILLGRRKDLLEARGLENSQFTSGSLQAGEQTAVAKMISLTATVRQYVIADVGAVLRDVQALPRIEGSAVEIWEEAPGWYSSSDPRSQEFIQRVRRSDED